jgi:AcrR family transcriptional regulator
VEPPALHRRQRRRQETIEEVLGHALEIMAEEGVAGLSLGEIARRMGIRPPSLYVYFASKQAIYDALFQRGWELLLADITAYDEAAPAKRRQLSTELTGFGERFAKWAVEHAAFAQLLFWRPVPGFQPSEDAYEPAVRFFALAVDRFEGLRRQGLVAGNVDTERMLRQWTILISGVITQQLANGPDESFDRGRFTTQIPELAEMFAGHYGTAKQGGPHQARTSTSTSRRQHVRTR